MSTALSKLAQQIGDSPTLKINAAARALKAAGEPVIHLGRPSSLPSAIE